MGAGINSYLQSGEIQSCGVWGLATRGEAPIASSSHAIFYWLLLPAPQLIHCCHSARELAICKFAFTFTGRPLLNQKYRTILKQPLHQHRFQCLHTLMMMGITRDVSRV